MNSVWTSVLLSDRSTRVFVLGEQCNNANAMEKKCMTLSKRKHTDTNTENVFISHDNERHNRIIDKMMAMRSLCYALTRVKCSCPVKQTKMKIYQVWKWKSFTLSLIWKFYNQSKAYFEASWYIPMIKPIYFANCECYKMQPYHRSNEISYGDLWTSALSVIWWNS